MMLCGAVKSDDEKMELFLNFPKDSMKRKGNVQHSSHQVMGSFESFQRHKRRKQKPIRTHDTETREHEKDKLLRESCHSMAITIALPRQVTSIH